jgi:hypothetical protein
VPKVTARAFFTDENEAVAKIPLHPKHPERVCWGCDLYCPADDLRCGNGTIRTQHPVELFGDDWVDDEIRRQEPLNNIELTLPRR